MENEYLLLISLRRVPHPGYRVPMNWSDKLRALVERGKCSLVGGMEKHLTEAVFPRERKRGRRRPRFYVEYFYDDLTTNEIVAELMGRGKRPATMYHALAFGIDCPDLLIGGKSGELNVLHPYQSEHSEHSTTRLMPYIARYSGADPIYVGSHYRADDHVWRRLSLFAAVDA